MTRVLCEKSECRHNKRGRCTAPEIDVVLIRVPDSTSIHARYDDALGVTCPGDGANQEASEDDPAV
ncbi:MAG: DUF1540 domain-containing protein [Bacillota bacterium]